MGTLYDFLMMKFYTGKGVRLFLNINLIAASHSRDELFSFTFCMSFFLAIDFIYSFSILSFSTILTSQKSIQISKSCGLPWKIPGLSILLKGYLPDEIWSSNAFSRNPCSKIKVELLNWLSKAPRTTLQPSTHTTIVCLCNLASYSMCRHHSA